MNTPEIVNIDIGSDMNTNLDDNIGLLMNTKKLNNSSTSLSDLDNEMLNLEKELNNLTDNGPSTNTTNKIDINTPIIETKNNTENTSSNSLFNYSFFPDLKLDDNKNEEKNSDEDNKIKLEEPNIKPVTIPNLKPINLNLNENKTWDGYSSKNDNETKDLLKKPILTKEQLLREKYKILRKLDKIEDKGARLSKKYSIDDSLEEIQSEYDELIEQKEKDNAVKFYGSGLTNAVQMLEWANGTIDPFDIKLDGWAESVEQNLDDYDEIFEELHEKYKSKGKMAPELRLLWGIGSSAVQVHFSNQLMKMAMPDSREIFSQNPELAEQFTNAALNTMSKDTPGFVNFMKSSAPEKSKKQNERPEMKYNSDIEVDNNKGTQPDIGMFRGNQSFDDSVDVNNTYGNFNEEPKQISFVENKIPDMKGPDNIDDILSGFKTALPNTKSGTPPVVSLDNLQNTNNPTYNLPKKNRKKSNLKRKSMSMDL
jgi:hypothetical protein